jgi:hypothetical protein
MGNASSVDRAAGELAQRSSDPSLLSRTLSGVHDQATRKAYTLAVLPSCLCLRLPSLEPQQVSLTKTNSVLVLLTSGGTRYCDTRHILDDDL